MCLLDFLAFSGLPYIYLPLCSRMCVPLVPFQSSSPTVWYGISTFIPRQTLGTVFTWSNWLSSPTGFGFFPRFHTLQKCCTCSADWSHSGSGWLVEPSLRVSWNFKFKPWQTSASRFPFSFASKSLLSFAESAEFLIYSPWNHPSWFHSHFFLSLFSFLIISYLFGSSS